MSGADAAEEDEEMLQKVRCPAHDRHEALAHDIEEKSAACVAVRAAEGRSIWDLLSPVSPALKAAEDALNVAHAALTEAFASGLQAELDREHLALVALAEEQGVENLADCREQLI